MRIQHNIMAMNAYRNYNTNTKALSGNLEKLSSGYKINRAGDDAAGLAISEKMRAQITGLDAAQKNVKDGISLVKTAEGAMQEIQDMLNRMDYLATQSANGTYDNEVDRLNLQKEVNALKSEINRIADSSNFNGIKLMDGSLAGKSQVDNLAISYSTATQGKYVTGAATDLTMASLATEDIGGTLDFTVSWLDGNGQEQQTKVSLTYQGDGTGVSNSTVTKNYFTDEVGNKYNLATGGKLEKENIIKALNASLQADDAFASAFNVSMTDTSTTITAQAKVAGTGGAQLTGISVESTLTTTPKSKLGTNAAGMLTIEDGIKEDQVPYDSMQKFAASGITLAANTDTQDDLKAKIFEIDGHKFLVAKDTTLTDDQIRGLGDDVNIIEIATSLTTAADVKEIASEITRVTGLATSTYATAPANSGITANTDIVFTKNRLSLSGRTLTLQIGDTADKFNQMEVKIGDMHTSAMGSKDSAGTITTSISDINIGDQEGAAAAVQVIRDAINYVSGIRGDLGAIQNRLEHTQNNLSVMAENIQDAESTIRDTDVANEMMSYVKNNILVQSAQAMLAQANQVPQGVLQLLG